MAKFTIEVMKTLVAQVEVEADSPAAALDVVKDMNKDGILVFFDPEIEDEYTVL